MKKRITGICSYLFAGILFFCLGLYCGRRMPAPITEIHLAETADDSDAVPDKLNINTAGAQALSALPGISAADIKHILLFRAQNGPFQSKKDLLRVKGFTEEKFRSIEDLITAGG